MHRVGHHPARIGSCRLRLGRSPGHTSCEPLETRILFAQSIWAYPGADGKLLYKPLPLGDKIGDYSNVGYMAGTAAIPDVPTRVTVSPVAGDDQASIQNAINAVQALAPDANGIRGAVLLNPGTYEIPGTLNITASGVVLRGSGQGQTILLATGTEKDTTVQIDGSATRAQVGSAQTIADDYVPVGAISFTVPTPSAFAVGDTVLVHRAATAQWIHDIGMDLLTNPWTGRDIDMDRTITRIDGNVITIDAPITQALDKKYGGGQIWKYTATGRISNVGVEYVSGRSTFDPTLLSGSDRIDENHAEHFIGVDGVVNGWVRNVTSEFYGYSCVNMTGPSKWVTVQDSQCLDPVSVVTGGRRYSFNMGDATNVLWKNLYTRGGRHDYVQGSEVTGPNVVVDSRADTARSDTGPHHRYSTGTLWDNVDVNGHSINIQNRGNSGTGHGWAGANQVVWNSEANNFTIQNIGSPVSAWNWAIGNVGGVQTGSPGPMGSQGFFDSHGAKVDTRSLFHAQAAERQAVDSFALREVRLGDADNYLIDAGGADNVPVDAAWRTAVQNASGQTGVGFDAAGTGQLVPFTFNFAIDPGTYVAGASLSVGYKSAGGSSVGDVIYFESAGRRYTWAELGVPAPTTTAGATVIDLSKLLPALQDGRLNFAISGNTAIDWATLNFQTGSITSPKATTLTAAEDAYVDQALPTSNFGTNASLFTKRNGATDNRESYLKWDLAGMAGFVTGATLRLVPTAGGAGATGSGVFGNGVGAIFNRVSFVNSDAWTEAGINWNNRPAADPYFREFVSYPNEPVTADVTALVRAAQAGDKKLSLLLNTYIDNANSQVTFASSENGNAAFRPQLVIETLDGVAPVADATVRGGASGNINFGTTTDLSVKNDTAASLDNDREAYLRFDLNGLPGAPTNAFLRMMPLAVPGVFTHAASPVADDAWTETGITWNNKPAAGAALGSTIPATGTYASFNVTAAAAAAFASDRLLSLRVSSDTASAASQVQYASREHAALLSRPMLVSSNVRPTITDIPRVETALNTPATGRWLGMWDAETPAGSLTLSATSSNPALLPVGNITFGGGGIDRTLSLAPAAGQAGTSNVTITVTDAQGQTAQATFQFVVTNAVSVDGDQGGPNTDDVFRVVRSGANVTVFRNGVLVVDVAQTTANHYTINGLGGNDTLIVDYAGGNPVPAGGLTLDGGTGNDVVRVVGSAGADAVALAAENVSLAGGGAFGYAGGEMLELQLGAGADTLAVAGNATVTAQILLLTLAGGGSLAMAAGAALPDFTDVTIAAGTTFNLGGQNQSLDALAGAGTVLNSGAAAATLTVGAQGSSSSFAGTLANGTQTLGLTKVGAGTLVLAGNNAYTGISTISGGAIESGNAASFAGLGGVVRFTGGTFRVTADTVAANVLNKWTTAFPGAPGSNTGTFDVAAGVTLTLGAAGGPAAMRTAGDGAGGQFIKTGAGTLRLLTNNGQQDDPFRLDQGTVVAESASALGGGDAGVRLDAKNGTTLVLRQNASTSFLTPLNAADAAGTVNVVIDRQSAGAGVTHSLNTFTSAGAFTLNVTSGPNVAGDSAGLTLGSATPGGNATINVAAGAILTVTGAVGGGGGGASLAKIGQGTLILNGVNTYTGTTTLIDGALGGVGTMAGSVTNAAVVRPGVLTVNGNYSQSAAGMLEIELAGPAAGVEYDRLAVAGTVSLGGQLSANLAYAAADGQTFVVLDNAGADPISGAFSGLPEGATLAAGGRTLRVSYAGGDGNDVTLTVLAAPAVVTDVFVAGTAWNAAYRNHLQATGDGEPAYGYRIKADEQTRTIAWSNLNQVSVRFSRHVSVVADDLVVRGVNVANYSILPGAAGFSYDPATFTATWTFTRAIPNDKVTIDLDGDHDGPDGAGVRDGDGNLLDGEWTNPAHLALSADGFPSGNGSPGGDFVFNFRILPGDVSRDGAVNVFDYNILRANLNQSGKGVAGGDLNGDNLIDVIDFNLQRAYLNKTAPV